MLMHGNTAALSSLRGVRCVIWVAAYTHPPTIPHRAHTHTLGVDENVCVHLKHSQMAQHAVS